MVATVAMDKSRIAKWLRQSLTDVAATPTQPFLENSDIVPLLLTQLHPRIESEKDAQNMWPISTGKSRSGDGTCFRVRVPGMPIRVMLRELAT